MGTKISELNDATTPFGNTDYFPVVQSGATKKGTFQSVSRKVMTTADKTANQYAKIKTWNVSTSAVRYAAESLFFSTLAKAPVASAFIEVQIRTDATGTLDSSTSKILVQSLAGDSFAHDQFFLAQPSAGVVELYVQAVTSSGTIAVQELSAEFNGTSSAYNDDASWSATVPTGIGVTSDWAGSGWITPSLLNGWTVSGSFQYRKSADGWIHWLGRIAPGTETDGTSILTVQAGYRMKSPGVSFIIASNITGAAGARVFIDHLGNFQIYNADTAGSFYDVDIKYLAEN